MRGADSRAGLGYAGRVGSRRTALHARELGLMRVLDPDGREVRLGDLWRERTIALVFIRHFG